MEKLTLLEYQCLAAQERGSLNENTFAIIEKHASKLKPKDAFYTKKCISMLKENAKSGKNLKNVIFKAYELKENVLKLLKEDSDGKARALKDKANLKNIRVSVEGTRDRDLETLFVDFDIDIKPYGKSKAAVGREIERIIKKNSQLGSKIIRRILPEFPEFLGSGIFQGNLRMTPVSPGSYIKAKNELTIDTDYANNPKTFEEYVILVSRALDVLDKEVMGWLEIDNYDEDNVDEVEASIEDEDDAIEQKDKAYYKDEEEFAPKSDEEIEREIQKNLKSRRQESKENKDKEVIQEEEENVEQVKPITSTERKSASKESIADAKQELRKTIQVLDRVVSGLRTEFKHVEEGISPYMDYEDGVQELIETCKKIRRGIPNALNN